MAAEKILIVEDDEALLVGLRDILEFAGFHVTTASNGLEGLTELEKGAPHLILSDINMPKMDGYGFYEAVRARPDWVSIPFIFLTAKGDKTDIRRGKQLGADDYLVKPFDEEDLLVAIRAKLDRHAQLDAAQNRQVTELKRTILTTLNHEFRTPLTYITSYTELLHNADPEMGADEFKKMLHGIEAGSERLRKLVEDFIFLVELQSGAARRTYERRRVVTSDLPMLLRDVLKKFDEIAAERQVGLIPDFPERLPALLADRDYLTNALKRLVDNGIKFSKKQGGKVTLSAQAAGGRIIIQVKDEGLGIRAEALRQLFNIFHQIDRAKLEQQGSGSGLAIAREIVTMHGGALTVESEYGVGSTFTIELPVAPQQ